MILPITTLYLRRYFLFVYADYLIFRAGWDQKDRKGCQKEHYTVSNGIMCTIKKAQPMAGVTCPVEVIKYITIRYLRYTNIIYRLTKALYDKGNDFNFAVVNLLFMYSTDRTQPNTRANPERTRDSLPGFTLPSLLKMLRSLLVRYGFALRSLSGFA
jgi:hypothetical protein